MFQITSNTVSDDEPTWSPDGQRIAYQSWDGTDYEIYSQQVFPSAGTPSAISENSSFDGEPDWSVNDQIAFASTRDGEEFYNVYTMASSGGSVSRLTSGNYDAEPYWSPSGNYIAFISNRDFATCQYTRDVYIMDTSGAIQSRLQACSEHNNVAHPSWTLVVPMPTPTPTATATPSFTPFPMTIQGYIDELATYGVITEADGLPAGVAVTSGGGINWTLQELDQVLIGVQNTAEAFYILKYGVPSGANGMSQEAKALLLSVMDTPDSVNPALEGFYLLRVTNDFQYGNDPDCDAVGTQDEGCTSNGNSAIGLYGQFYQSNNIGNVQLTMVHELGHRFDNQSKVGQDQNPENWLHTRVDVGPIGSPDRGAFVIRDCTTGNWARGERVMGRFGSNPDWLRGERGWGTAPPQIPPSGFQQNALSIIIPADQFDEISEAGADMFLNWAYRRITDTINDPSIGSPCGGTNQIGTWLDFAHLHSEFSAQGKQSR